MGNWKSCQRPSAGRGHHHGAKVSFNLPTTIQLYFQFTHNFSGVISIYLLSDSIRAWEIETHMSVGAPMSNTSATQKRVSIYHYIAVRFSIYQRRCPPRYWTTLNGFQFTHHVSVSDVCSIYPSHLGVILCRYAKMSFNLPITLQSDFQFTVRMSV